MAGRKEIRVTMSCAHSIFNPVMLNHIRAKSGT
jgi:hypothetical protein